MQISGQDGSLSLHEVLDNTVELGTLVSKAKFNAFLVLAGRKGTEVLNGFWDSLKGPDLEYEDLISLKQETHSSKETYLN